MVLQLPLAIFIHSMMFTRTIRLGIITSQPASYLRKVQHVVSPSTPTLSRQHQEKSSNGIPQKKATGYLLEQSLLGHDSHAIDRSQTLFFDTSRTDLALLTNVKEHPAVRAEPLGSPRGNVRQVHALQVEPFLFAVLFL